MVLGSNNGGSGPRCASGRVGGSLFGTGQQPPSVHVDPVGQDCSRTHQHTDPVQWSPVPAGFQHPGSAQPLLLPQRAQSGAALHESREDSRGGAGGGRGPLQALPQYFWGDVPGTEAEVGCVQASRPSLFAAPHTARHQPTHWLPWPVTTPEASAALHAGVSLQGMRGAGDLWNRSLWPKLGLFQLSKDTVKQAFHACGGQSQKQVQIQLRLRLTRLVSRPKTGTDPERNLTEDDLQEKYSTVINTYFEIEVEVVLFFFLILLVLDVNTAPEGEKELIPLTSFMPFYFIFSAKTFCNFYMCTLFFL